MPTHDYIIANGTGAAVRADINLALSAIVSLNSSASEPATMYAYQLWADTALGLLKIRNSANSAWITLRQLDGDFSIVAVEDGLQATPSLTFTNDLNTGVFRSGADALGIVTGGQYAIACTSTQAVGIKTANPSTALHVAGNARVGADDVTDAHLQIGKGATGNRNSYIDIVADTTYTDYGLRVIRNNTGANATSELKHRGTGALNFTTQEAAPIVFNTTNSPALTILAGGNVGIGTSNVNAGSKLHIARNTGGDSATVRLSGNDGAGDGGAAIVFADNETVKWTAFTRRFSSANKLYISTAENDTAASKVTITEGGLVGIGSTSPGSRLEIGGDASSDARVTFNRVPVQASNDGVIGELFFQNNADSVALIAVKRQSAADDAYIQFATQQTTGGLSEKCRITSDGKLLVGTSSATAVTDGNVSAQLEVEGTTTATSAISIIRNSNDTNAGGLIIAKSRGTAAGSNTLVSSGDTLGFIQFQGADGTQKRIGASIDAVADAATGSNDLPTRLVFSTNPGSPATSPTERMRITSGGILKVSNSNTYEAGNFHQFNLNTGSQWTLGVLGRNTTDPYGIRVEYTNAAPNGTVSQFLYCIDTAGVKTEIRSNGGLANYSANNANLSDRNVKKDITLAAGTWDCIKEWEIVNYRYKDQPDDADLNLGVIAQQVAESCPEVITIFQEAKEATEDKPAQEERLGVKEQQMYWMAIKALQEAMKRIETLETEVAALKTA